MNGGNRDLFKAIMVETLTAMERGYAGAAVHAQGPDQALVLGFWAASISP